MTKRIKGNKLPGRLDQYITEVEANYHSIHESRKNDLAEVAAYVSDIKNRERDVQLTFICTHNSRRSHFSQIWAQVAAFHYGIEKVFCYSGGTEATAFNYRAVEAIKRCGLQVSVDARSDNPVYCIRFSMDEPEIQAFSKKYDDPFNPQSAYAAIMTCSHADENCPVVFGADKRFPITYTDPKEADNTPEEASNYDMRCKQIATEMFYLFSCVE